MQRFLTIIILLTATIAHAQDITGIWQGHFHATNLSERSSLLSEPRYKFEVQIAQKDKAFQGVTYSYLSSIFYGKAAATGTVNPKTGKVLLQEGKLLEFRNEAGDDVCIMTCFMQYSRSGDEEFLEGSYISMSVRDSSNCGRGTVFLRKVSTSDFYKEPFVAKREMEIAAEKEEKKTVPATKKAVSATAKAKPSTGATKPVAGITKPKPAATNPASGTSTTTGSAKKPSATTNGPGASNNGSVTSKPAHPLKPPATPPQAIQGTTQSASSGQKPMPQLSKVNSPGMRQPALSADSTAGKGIGRQFPVVTPEVLRSRSNEVVRTIVVNTNEVVLNIYDDGAIDGDTISVYLDKKLVIPNTMLTEKAIVLTLHLDETNNYHELVMVAENEGTIPPNTSLMIVKAGDQRFEVRITSTEQKNAVVIFKYEKPQ